MDLFSKILIIKPIIIILPVLCFAAFTYCAAATARTRSAELQKCVFAHEEEENLEEEGRWKVEDLYLKPE